MSFSIAGHDTVEEFVESWVQGWNSHDAEAVLAHFAEDCVFTSPIAAQLVPESGGVIRGKERLRAYWAKGLELLPDLHFESIGIYLGVATVAIHYRNQAGRLVVEVLSFDDAGLVTHGIATYAHSGSAS